MNIRLMGMAVALGLLAGSTQSEPSADDRFKGGSYDGWDGSSGEVMSPPAPSGTADDRFKGGSYDGWARRSTLDAPVFELEVGLVKTVGYATGTYEDSVAELTTTNGALLRFWFVISNPGQTALTNVVLNDVLLGIADEELLSVDLEPGQSITAHSGTFSADWTVTGSRTNTATVLAGSVQGDTGAESSAVVLVRDLRYGMTFSKEVGESVDGEFGTDIDRPIDTTVYFRFVTANTGEVGLAEVKLNDPALGITDYAMTNLLHPGHSVTHTVSWLITGPLVNTATNTAKTADALELPVEETDSAEVIVRDLLAGVSFGKSVGLSASGPFTSAVDATNNATVYYRLIAVNTGEVTATSVELNDAMLGLVGHALVNIPAGHSVTHDVPHQVSWVGPDVTPIVNTARVDVVANPGTGALPFFDTDTAMVNREETGDALVALSSGADQSFVWTNAHYNLNALTVTITERGESAMDATVRILLPAFWAVRFDSTVSPLLGGAAGGKLGVAGYVDGYRTLQIAVDTALETGDVFTVGDLRLIDLHLANPGVAQRLKLEVTGFGAAEALDTHTLSCTVIWKGGSYDGWDRDIMTDTEPLFRPAGATFMFR